MTDRPILFSSPMVRALDEGRKSQTRRGLSRLRGFKGRITQFGRSDTTGYDWHFRDGQLRWHDLRHREMMAVLPWKVGDRLWVREAFAFVGEPQWPLYRASGYEAECDRHGFDKPYPPETEVRWRSSIHMPRRASRLTLIVEAVRIERLHDISPFDARKEGVKQLPGGWYSAAEGQSAPDAKSAFAVLWNSINGDRAWDVNAWVSATTFRVIKANIDSSANPKCAGFDGLERARDA